MLKKFNTTQVSNHPFFTELESAFNTNFQSWLNCIDRIIMIHEEMALSCVVSLLNDPGILGSLLHKITTDPFLNNRMLDESYYHLNGFDKIVLINRSNFKIRLHNFLPRPEKRPMENIHDHRWNFASAMLKGSFKTDLFTNGVKQDLKTQSYTYYSDKLNDKYETVYNGEVFLEKLKTLKISQGDNYFIPSDALHRINGMNADGTVTIIVTGPPINNTCQFYASRLMEEEEKNLVKHDPLYLQNLLTAIPASLIKIAA